MSQRTLLQDAWLTVVRTALGLIVPTAIAFVAWYSQRGFSPRQHADVVGFLSVLALAGLGLHALRLHVYPRYGRATITAFVIWAGSSAFWRALSFLGVIDADTRLLGNTITAALLALAGLYVHFTHQMVLRTWTWLTRTSTGTDGGGHDTY